MGPLNKYELTALSSFCAMLARSQYKQCRLKLPSVVLTPESRELADKATLSAKPIHFPWLTEVRFVAAFAVVIHHIAQARWLAGLGSQPQGPIEHLGNHGVRLFFVLSGFLITHLLLTEKAKTGTIAIKKFYWRRVLRIWPLYYALLAVAIILPTELFVIKDPSMTATLATAKFQDWPIKFSLLVCLLPNVALMFYPAMQGFAQAWSVGVEEQFYLIWPVLMKKLGDKPLVALGSVIGLKVAVALAFNWLFFFSGIWLPPPVFNPLVKLFSCVNIFQIEAMVIGGAAAYLLLQKRQSVIELTRNVAFRAALAVCMVVCLSQAWSQLHEQICCDIVYAGLLLTLTLSSLKLPNLIEKPLQYFGKISYGIYMLHPIAIAVVLKALSMTHIPVSNTFFALLFCVGTFVLTLLISSASYEFYERRFLRMKHKFTVVESSS